MPKIDERSPTVTVDAEARRRLAAALDRPGVAAAYLFGSQARGAAGPLSDVDLAVVSDRSLPRSRRFDLQLELIGAATAVLATNEVDLVMLDDAPPLLRHRVIRDGLVLVDRDPSRRLTFQTRSVLEYLDTKPLRGELSRGLRHRLREDRFGRP